MRGGESTALEQIDFLTERVRGRGEKGGVEAWHTATVVLPTYSGLTGSEIDPQGVGDC